MARIIIADDSYFSILDLLIVDFQMPNVDGISLIEEIANEDPDAKFIQCTISIKKLQNNPRMNKSVSVITKRFNKTKFIESLTTVLAN
ncbi:response regulator [Paenibacillus sp. FA6]|uniref:response regulator n=1 Tax=Paenibacillus sp. FA6 TaxID=3413029 RepID=UPI003F65E10D